MTYVADIDDSINSPTKHWKGEKITLSSIDHFDKLIQEGFEIIEHVIEMNDGLTSITLLMKCGEKQIIADATEIDDHIIRSQYLYDFKKRKISFTRVEDTNIFWDFQKTMYDILEGNYVKPLKIKQIPITQRNLVYNYLAEWLQSEKNLILQSNNFSIFSNTCILNMKDQKMSIDIISKDNITLSQIHNIEDSAKTLDFSIALSFFIFTKTLLKIDDTKDDLLVGIILYDVKNNDVLCFNIKSVLSFYNNRNYDKFTVLSSIVDDLFQKSIDIELNCKSFIPFPINSRWYTPLPWLQYSVLCHMELNDNLAYDDVKKINIPQFFTFGAVPDLQKRGNITYEKFSNTKNGRIVCVLIFTSSDQKIPYVLRFDQSKTEPLVHLDFTFKDIKGESKLISHKQLNFENIYNFDRDLFLSMILAGLFDSHFTSIINDRLRGTRELNEKNPGIFVALNVIYKVEKAIDWLNVHKVGYDILDKLYQGESLSTSELKMVDEIRHNELGIITPADATDPLGINLFGFIVRYRYKNGMTNTSLT